MQADYPGAEAHFLPADQFGYPNKNGHVAIIIHKTGGDPCAGYLEYPFLNEGVSFMEKGNIVWKSALSTAYFRTDDLSRQHKGVKLAHAEW